MDNEHAASRLVLVRAGANTAVVGVNEDWVAVDVDIGAVAIGRNAEAGSVDISSATVVATLNIAPVHVDCNMLVAHTEALS